ncbi:pseudouridine synthase [Chromatocurvus halotolerans]|uniref:Pseudouridine synthase n=1 Tax=Chromatocurvus halotolerans TaxID=1132028 RepID=A0A4R2KS04_9GAMM|nr:16S rRNA pseudouridine(516) synthase [Chromatocurvus halotolerans]TCO75552.1 ribosomal small subunit pseudouridine synthase A [Chromatocurvus halotolerans]
MSSYTTRLDRFISQHSDYSIADTRLLLAQRRIMLDGAVADSVQQAVTKLTHVELDGVCLQSRQPVYLALHKPRGMVSATKDSKHPTVLDLVDHPRKDELHIAGRLDFNTTGLVLLTNDGAWSRRISLPQTKLPKTYEVTLSEPLNEAYVAAFQAGIEFAHEGITTLPARLEILSAHRARLSLVEGKYHQVKRMFGSFRNKVLALHRVSVGPVCLGGLEPGATRPIGASELAEVSHRVFGTRDREFCP